MIGLYLVGERLLVASSGRLHGKLGNVVAPQLLGAYALLDQCLDPVSNHGAGVLLYGSFQCPLVVVDEQAAKVRHLLACLCLQELQAAHQRVGRATAQLSLVLDWGTGRAQVHRRRQGWRRRRYCRIQLVALIWTIGHPSIPGIDRVGLLHLPCLSLWVDGFA